MLNSFWKKSISCLVIVAFIGATTGTLAAQQAAPQGAGTTADGMRDGQLLAEQKKTGGKLAGGLAIGALTGVIGTGIGYFVIGPESFTPEAMKMTEGKNSDYQLGFKTGWEQKTKEKKRNAFLAGGVLGTLAFVALLVSANSSSNQ